MANTKFDKLVKMLEDAKTKQPIQQAVTAGPNTGETIFFLNEQQPSMAKQVTCNPDVLNKVAEANNLAAIMMPLAPYDEWLVQVRPDDNNVLHFQAKSMPSVQEYLRVYKQVDDATYTTISDAFSSHSGASKRTSFYHGSTTPYLICKRVGDTSIEIPGYGACEIPELFPKVK